MKTREETKVTLELAEESQLPEFRKRLQEAFATAVIETFGDCDDGPIPSDKDVQESFNAPGAVVYHILQDGKKVGGAVLRIDSETHHNSLDLIYVSPEHHSRGIGLSAWKAIEARYPDTVLWETVTPYFEKRNIHFYVNKCGFQIVEFYNEHHSDPHMHHNGHEDDDPLPGDDDFFRLVKVMKKLD
jgi:GNAT superfamily N-acetyltransferase